jgi:hypothetical protein
MRHLLNEVVRLAEGRYRPKEPTGRDELEGLRTNEARATDAKNDKSLTARKDGRQLLCKHPNK